MRLVLLASGSTGNCALISEGDTHLLIDAGISARRICGGLQQQGLELRDIAGVLVTHEHTDHIAGLRVLLRRAPLPVYTIAPAARALRALLPEHADALCEIEPDCAALVGGAAVTPFCTQHDAAGSCGYRISGESGSVGFCTDLGAVTETVRCALRGLDGAVFEANHDIDMLRNGPYPAYLKRRILSDYGHLSNDAAGDLAAELAYHGTRSLILGHLSRHNNTPQRALETVSRALCAALPPEALPELCAAPEAGPLAVEIGARVCCL